MPVPEDRSAGPAPTAGPAVPEGFAHRARDVVRVQGKPVEAFWVLPPEAGRGTPRRITETGEEVLARPCRDVTAFGDPGLSRLIDDMFVTMYIADGAGLAANQVGVGLRVFVYDCPDEDGVRHVGHIVNPVLDPPPAEGRRLVEGTEGCLSVPGARRELARAAHAVVRGFDKDGEPLVLEGEGFFARCLQHETDHLSGGLYLDRLSKRDRKDALRQMADQYERVMARRAENAALLGHRLPGPDA